MFFVLKILLFISGKSGKTSKKGVRKRR